MTRALRTPRSDCEPVRQMMIRDDVIDLDLVPLIKGSYAFLPLKKVWSDASKHGKVIDGIGFKEKPRVLPFESIMREVNIPSNLKKWLPRKWKIISDVLVLRLPDRLWQRRREVARAYAKVLRTKSVLHVDAIKGEFRNPECVLLYGKSAVTTHRENGVLFRLDASKVMFSKGNTYERARIAKLVRTGERVLDMFAGIGYFSLPIAVHSSPAIAYACEKSPLTFRYLKENIKLNKVERVVVPVLCDSREFHPETKCDRIIMGYLPEKGNWIDGRLAAWDFLDTAIRNLSDSEGACVHLHVLEKREAEPLKSISGLVTKNRRDVKSYAPSIWHVVYDLGR